MPLVNTLLVPFGQTYLHDRLFRILVLLISRIQVFDVLYADEF